MPKNNKKNPTFINGSAKRQGTLVNLTIDFKYYKSTLKTYFVKHIVKQTVYFNLGVIYLV